MHIKNSLALDRIQAAMNLLYELIKEIDNYQDKSLFFQDPRVIEGWLLLAGEIKEIEIEDTPESGDKWELRSEPFAESLLARRDLFSNYKKLYHLYYDPLYSLWMNYSIDGECISADAMDALKADHYEKILNVEDFDQYLEDVNSRSNDARYFVNKTLTYIFDILQAIMNKAGQVVIDLKPSDEDFAKAINDDLRGMMRKYGNSLFRDMKEDIHRHFNQRFTDNNRYELWNERLRADEKSLLLASKQQLAACEDEMQEHWGDDRKAQMDENGKLMHLIYSSCYTEELFDLGKAENVKPFIDLLTTDNLTIFYDIIARRNIIQCEMFPELKKQHEEWLKGTKEQPEEDEEIGLGAARQTRLDEIISILQKGNLKQPATADNIELLLNTIFGKDTSMLDGNDIKKCNLMWAWAEGGRLRNKKEIVPANLAGYFRKEGLFLGTPKEISVCLFGNDKQKDNINKGDPKYSSNDNYKDNIIPFLNKYIGKIIKKN